ncbi:GNAT family N-acetyltransferase [Lysinibacillus sp. OL1_EC]|uniref:aminoglycoside 6'-N-acetyltransferase n=1 Tax=unclassified Lysinibacillus TaxID=2636778 RepID=UPI001040AC99|nr:MULTISPECIES: aminoglycoside 6'-N-acetyltransferase [unclassified Lysinibacillus]MCM0622987.1 GNAT family N-acetyltransferase [Lysinibacillus sp. OL1_EC]TBV90083.1 GNAT family N-acetyltransferase [Lysinibacillus sp. OL1]WGT41560.1 GNAT family N-acetyltransferase [Lysinibacillus sp. 1 U-2021]
MIQQANQKDAHAAASLALLLWPNHTREEFTEKMTQLLKEENAAIFLVYDDDEAVGFAQCQLRTDYVEGTDSSPVGYLEGLFVREEYRQQGYARLLVEKCEQWAKHRGCLEFASDCEWDNDESLRVHLQLGFTEANRIICFTKKL